MTVKHVFIDTSVYKQVKFDLFEHSAFKQAIKFVNDEKLKLYTTDVVIQESIQHIKQYIDVAKKSAQRSGPQI